MMRILIQSPTAPLDLCEVHDKQNGPESRRRDEEQET